MNMLQKPNDIEKNSRVQPKEFMKNPFCCYCYNEVTTKILREEGWVMKYINVIVRGVKT